MKTKPILKTSGSSQTSRSNWRKLLIVNLFIITSTLFYGQTERIAPPRPTLSVSGETNPCPNRYYNYQLNNIPETPDGYSGPFFDWTPVKGSGFSTNANCNIIWDNETSGSITGIVIFKKANTADMTYSAKLNVTIKKLGSIGQISGPTSVPCGSTTPVNYYVPAVANANLYQWTLPPGWTFAPGSCTTCNQISVIPPTSCKSGWICVVAKNTDCSTQTTSSCVYVKNENPVPVLNSPIMHICTTSPHDYPYSINPLPGALNYSWNVTGAGASIPGNPTGPSATLHTDQNVNGNITLTVTAYFPYNKTTQVTITINLTNQTPSAPQLTGNKYLECVYYDDVVITVNNIPSAYSTGYTWSFTGPIGGIKLVGAGPQINVIANRVGSYNVYAKATNACGTSPLSWYYPIDVIECSRQIMTTAIPTEDAATDAKEIIFYPNPASNSFELVLPSKGTAQIKLISLHGQVIKQFEMTDQQANLNVSDVAPGLYILSIYSNGETVNKRIEITR